MDSNNILIVKNNDGMDIEIKVLEVVESDLGDKYLYYEIKGVEGRFISSVEIDGDEYVLDEITPEEKEIVEMALKDNGNADILGGD